MSTRRRFIQHATTAALTVAAVGRSFAQSAATAAGSTKVAGASAPVRRTLKKGFMLATLRGPTAQKLSVMEKFKLLAAAGFDGVEVMSAMDQKEVLAARDATGLKIPSVCCSTHWMKPLTDPSADVRAVGQEGLQQSLRDAKVYGAKSVLLVPGKVTKTVSYADALTRSKEEIKKAIPLAKSLGVIIAIENVWNQFLLSPTEAVDYVDSFKSPWVRWHFDAGNVSNMGWPEQWVHILGPRIVQIHIKEYSREVRDKRGPHAGFEVDLFEGDSDWPAVMAAVDDVKYSGWLIAEQYRIPGLDDGAWLKHLSAKLDDVIRA